MKEMQLFEVGFKEKFSAQGYFSKFYVSANDAEHAEIKARQWIMEDGEAWDGYESEKDKANYIESLKGLKLARLHHIGTTIV